METNNRHFGLNQIHLPEKQARSTPKVTDHPWHTISSSYSEFSPSPSTSMESVDNNKSKYDWRMHSLLLSKHILTRGLIEGIGSDIQVNIPVWNKKYDLHRLVLDQNPYFRLLLQGSFQEATSSQITLHFEKDNPFITVDSFQLVLEYLYGKIEEPQITQANVKQILATCSYFQLDIYAICVDFVLKNLNYQNVIDYLLFTNQYLVQGSDRICDAIFTFLCREAYYMDKSILATLPLDWLEKVIESDAFWVPSEYERYQFVKEIIHARYIHSKSSSFVYTDLDTNPNCAIITRAIYYVHMTFEQLESIEKDMNPFTNAPFVPMTVLKEALWTQIKLRSKIEACLESQTALDIITTIKHDLETKKKHKSNEQEDQVYYPIPTDDATTYTGESAISLAFSSMSLQPTNPVKKTVIQPKTVQYSMYPPFRFSVEFPDVTSLKHGMRVYSEVVFYAGSNWNMYIQKTRSRKGVLQLGVYLHRQSIPNNQSSQMIEENNSQHEYTQVNSRTSSTTTISSSTEPRSFSRYSDRRKVTKTWFKIYCPTRGPKHALTLFQSSPDDFSVLQSWGWRSTTLCADEDNSNSLITNEDESGTIESASPPPLLYSQHSSTLVQYLQSTYDLRSLKTTSNNNNSTSAVNPKNAPMLRFTVVMGHV